MLRNRGRVLEDVVAEDDHGNHAGLVLDHAQRADNLNSDYKQHELGKPQILCSSVHLIT